MYLKNRALTLTAITLLSALFINTDLRFGTNFSSGFIVGSITGWLGYWLSNKVMEDFDEGHSSLSCFGLGNLTSWVYSDISDQTPLLLAVTSLFGVVVAYGVIFLSITRNKPPKRKRMAELAEMLKRWRLILQPVRVRAHA